MLDVTNLPRDTMVQLPLEVIDLTDHTYRFRDQLRLTKLQKSIEADGIQIPVIVRPYADGVQLVAGFRRCSAARALGMESVPAIVRDLDDDTALRACLLENTERKTYSALDLALVIKRFEDNKKTREEIEKLLGLSVRQIHNIRVLLDLPASIRNAVADEEQRFSATHAIALRTLGAKYELLEDARKFAAFAKKWIPVVNEEELSVQQLNRRVNTKFNDGASSDFKGILNPKNTGGTRFRLKPVTIDTDKLSNEAKSLLREQLGRILDALES